MDPIKIGSFIYSKDEKDNWSYKADLAPFKKNGNLRKEYKDLPRFPVIFTYEKKEVEDFEKGLGEAIKDISIRLLSFIK